MSRRYANRWGPRRTRTLRKPPVGYIDALKQLHASSGLGVEGLASIDAKGGCGGRNRNLPPAGDSNYPICPTSATLLGQCSTAERPAAGPFVPDQRLKNPPPRLAVVRSIDLNRYPPAVPS